MTEPIDAAGIGRWVAEWIGGTYSAPRNDTGAGEQRIETSVERLGHAVVAAIAKFGTPPAVAGEPYGYVYMVQAAPIVGDERKVERTVFTRNKPPCDALALYTTPQPTQAQAGAVPLDEPDCGGESCDCRSYCKKKGGQHGADT